MALRKSPSDPIFTINKITLKAKDKPMLDLTSNMYDRDLQSAIYTFENVQLTLHVTSKQSLRSKSRGRNDCPITNETDENCSDLNLSKRNTPSKGAKSNSTILTTPGMRGSIAAVVTGKEEVDDVADSVDTKRSSKADKAYSNKFTSSQLSRLTQQDSRSELFSPTRQRGVFSPVPALSSAAKEKASVCSGFLLIHLKFHIFPLRFNRELDSFFSLFVF